MCTTLPTVEPSKSTSSTCPLSSQASTATVACVPCMFAVSAAAAATAADTFPPILLFYRCTVAAADAFLPSIPRSTAAAAIVTRATIATSNANRVGTTCESWES